MASHWERSKLICVQVTNNFMFVPFSEMRWGYKLRKHECSWARLSYIVVKVLALVKVTIRLQNCYEVIIWNIILYITRIKLKNIPNLHWFTKTPSILWITRVHVQDHYCQKSLWVTQIISSVLAIIAFLIDELLPKNDWIWPDLPKYDHRLYQGQSLKKGLKAVEKPYLNTTSVPTANAPKSLECSF